jgi:hypothetical protein
MQYGNIPQQQQQQQQPMWRVPPKGRLNLVIIEARLAKNYSMLTKMDPYIKITLAGKVFETETDNGGGKNPKWNKTIAWFVLFLLFIIFFFVNFVILAIYLIM